MFLILAFLSFAWATELPANICEGHLIDARARFAAPHARPAKGNDEAPVLAPGGLVVPFGNRPTPFLIPQPLRVKRDDFYLRPDLALQMPDLANYLKGYDLSGTPMPVAVTLTPAEYKSFLIRGRLPEVPAGQTRRMERMKPNRPVTALAGQIVAIFGPRSQIVSSNELPAWDLKAVVASDLFHDVIEETTRYVGATQANRVVKPMWWRVGDAEAALDLPLIFEMPLNPLEVLAFGRPPSREELEAHMGDVETFDRVVELKQTLFWLPLTRSLMSVVANGGDFIEGRPVAMDTDKFGDVWVTFCHTPMGCVKVDVERIDALNLIEYVPNGPDGSRRVIRPFELSEVEILANAWREPDAPHRLLIIDP